MKRRIAVIGLGYVGLPVAVAFARRFPGTIGFDLNEKRIAALRSGADETDTVSSEDLTGGGLELTADPGALAGADFFVVAVPTPIDAQRRPDLSALRSASRTVGGALKRGAIVVYESTVYPGVTEGVCGAILAEVSGLVAGRDFKLGYSPERINPGDQEHTLQRTIKIVSAEDEESLEVVAGCYEAIVDAGVYRAGSIQIAEAAKVIENVQRDLNISLMNELAIIFDRIGLDTRKVLDAAATKWNFHRYHPGLVGGHCIGVDPYYLTAKAEEVGIHPQVILAGRRVNDDMGRFVAQKTIKLLIKARRPVHDARIAVLGVTFKPNVPDIRNSRVPDIVRELVDCGAQVLVHDPLADPAAVAHEYGIELADAASLSRLDALVLATPHRALAPLAQRLVTEADPPRVVVDVLAGIDRAQVPAGTLYWRL